MGRFMSDYNFLMETRLAPEYFQVLSRISRAASEQGLNVYLVGGAVRDLTYGQQTIRDLDFAVEGNPEKILRHLSQPSPRGADSDAVATTKLERVQLNRRMNSAELLFSNGVRAELSMSRSEMYPKPGRRPDISPASIFEDLRRRDLSVNAMAVSLHPNSRGLLLDPTNGAADIERRELRIQHGRSLSEDPSRIYRLVRLGARLGFKPEERTKRYLDRALEDRLWQKLDPDQQGQELSAILREEDPGRVLRTLAAQGLLSGLDRKLLPRKIPYDRFKTIRSVASAVPGSDPYLLNFHSLVEKFGAGQRSRLARKILDDRKAQQTILGFERSARKLARTLSSGRAGAPSFVYKLLLDQPRTLLLFLLVHFRQTKIQKRIKHFLHKAPHIRASIPRAELLALGAKPGPKFEKIIERLFFSRLDGKIKTQPQLVKEFRKLAGIPEPKPSKLPKPVLAPKKAKVKVQEKTAAATLVEPPKPARPLAKSAGKKKPGARKAFKPKAKHR